MSTFTDNISLIKETCQISGTKIARMAGFPASTMMRIQSDEHAPQIKTVEAIAKALNLTSYELLFVKLDRIRVLDAYRKVMGLPGVVYNNDEVPDEVRARARDSYEKENILPLSKLLDAEPLFVGTKEDEPWGIHPVGSYCFRCESDDLLPRIARGYNIYVKPITTDKGVAMPSSSTLVGRAINGNAVYGHLVVSNGRMFIKPTNPETAERYEVDKVCGIIVGLNYFEE